MNIGEYIRDKDKKTYKKLMDFNKSKVDKERLTEREIRDLMSTRSYCRVNGAIRQRR